MTKGNYNVNGGYNNGKGSPSDTSFRNCICAMLIFIALCILIAIVAIVLSARRSSNGQNGDYSSADAVHGDGFKTTERTTPKSIFVEKLTTKRSTTDKITTTITTPTTTITTQQHALKTTTKSTTKHKGPVEIPNVVSETTVREEDAETITHGKLVTGTPEKKQPLKLPPEIQGISTTTPITVSSEVPTTTQEITKSTTKSITKHMHPVIGKIPNVIIETTTEILSTIEGSRYSEHDTIEEKTSPETSDEYSSTTIERGDDTYADDLLTMIEEDYSSSEHTTTETFTKTSDGSGSKSEDDLVTTTEEDYSSSEHTTTETSTETSDEYFSTTIEGDDSTSEDDLLTTTEEEHSSSEHTTSETFAEKSGGSSSTSEDDLLTTTEEDYSSSEHTTSETFAEKSGGSGSTSEDDLLTTTEEDYSSSEHTTSETFAEKNDGSGSTSEDDLLTTTEEDYSSSEYTTIEYSTTESVTETEESSTVIAAKSLIRNQANDAIKIDKRSDESTTKQVQKEASQENDGNKIANEFTGITGDPSTVSQSLNEDLVNPDNTNSPRVKECKTKSCTSTISRILSLMDHSADPCQDFYQYSCGGSLNAEGSNYMEDVWEQYRNVFTQTRVDKLTKPAFFEKFFSFYDSCVDHEKNFLYRERLQAVKNIVRDIGSFIQDDATRVDKIAFTKLLAKLILFKTFPVMEVNIDVDTETKKYILQITLPNRDLDSNGVMSDWPTYLDDERNCFFNGYNRTDNVLDLKDVYKSYLACRKDYTAYGLAVQNIIMEIAPYAGMEPFNITQKVSHMLGSLDWSLMKLANDVDVSSIQRAVIRRERNDYETKKVSDLQRDCDVMDWQLFFEEITGNAITPDMPVQVAFYNKIKHIMAEIKNGGSMLYNLLLSIYATDVYQSTVLPKHKTDRQEYCLRLSAHLFHDVFTYVYVDSADATLRKRQERTLENIFQILQTNLVDGLKASNWLDDDDRDSLVKKAENLEFTFAAWSTDCLDKQKLDMKYNEVMLGENFTENLIALMELKGKSLFSLVGEVFDETKMFCYFLNPYDIEPKSFYPVETIAIPYGLLRNIPLDVPGYVLVARAGIHLAQEMARHFDPVGIRGITLSDDAQMIYDELKTRLAFERTRTVNKQAVRFQSQDLTVNREIADNAALKMITETYDKWVNNTDLPWIRESFNKEKITFLAVAQEFCQKINIVDYMLHIYERPILPAPMRIEVMLANSKMFSDVFECAKGTNLNNEEVTRLQFPHLDVQDEDARRK